MTDSSHDLVAVKAERIWKILGILHRNVDDTKYPQHAQAQESASGDDDASPSAWNN